ncbi:hypothetical protein LS74_005950 [Helicobacter magdeburgensis]|uniref:Uncharacterized protein n=1 Tax=Helicobacter magdeburgensis TaxID=471858 RepID=A0A4U8SZ00_9HELI|nr:hypothetical protein [Helicobacter magdeburgensis]TLD92280.1 hypothetical protein LS74_005950 [Helicobacter magdeburgensis]
MGRGEAESAKYSRGSEASKGLRGHSACTAISAESSKIAQSLTFSKLNRDFFDNHQTSSTILECRVFSGLSLGSHSCDFENLEAVITC